MSRIVDIPLELRSTYDDKMRMQEEAVIEGYRFFKKDAVALKKQEELLDQEIANKVRKGEITDWRFAIEITQQRYPLQMMCLYGRSLMAMLDYVYTANDRTTIAGYSEEHCRILLKVIESSSFFFPVKVYALAEFTDTIDYGKIVAARERGLKEEEILKETGLTKGRYDYILDEFIRPSGKGYQMRLARGQVGKVYDYSANAPVMSALQLSDYLTVTELETAEQMHKDLDRPIGKLKPFFSRLSEVEVRAYIRLIRKVEECGGSLDELNIFDIAKSFKYDSQDDFYYMVYFLFHQLSIQNGSNTVRVIKKGMLEHLIRAAIVHDLKLSVIYKYMEDVTTVEDFKKAVEITKPYQERVSKGIPITW